MHLRHSHWWCVPLLLGLLALLYFAFESYMVPCALRSCPGRGLSLQQITNTPVPQQNTLSDLNGIEICLSIKFVEPLQRLELTGSPQLGSKGPYSVVYNYLRSSRFHSENETVTYSTHSTPEFMENIGVIADRWDGPVSVALFVPATDFCRMVHRLIYLRNCDKTVYREKVMWHIFWPSNAPPPSSWKLVPDETHVECDKLAADIRNNEDFKKTWRSMHKLPYPINVARNIARQASTTWFVLPSDVELFPSLGLATHFVNFIKHSLNTSVKRSFLSSLSETQPTASSSANAPRVYIVPVFEVQKNIPDTKEELMIQYARKTAVYFHKLVCIHCQKFPGLKEWISHSGTPGQLKAMSWSLRERPYHRWEPIFVCNRDDPLYEERLSWEGLQDKMTQMHELCLRGYQFHLLDRAFLVHAPGIKHPRRGRPSYSAWRQPFIEQNSRVYEEVLTEMEARLGEGGRERCPRH